MAPSILPSFLTLPPTITTLRSFAVMMWLAAVLSLLAISSHKAFASPLAPRQQAPTYTPNLERANAVKATFQHSWNGYYKHAFPHDSLRPVTNGWVDDRNGWGASAIDALSTAVVMGNVEVVGQVLAFIPKIDFNKTKDEVSVFETTIRYLGGLLSAYDLLTEMVEGRSYAKDKDLVKATLDQAVHLADKLKVAFDTPSGVPYNNLNITHPDKSPKQQTNGIATIGTLVLEWTRLSDITGDPQYGKLAQKAEGYLLSPEPAWAEPFPGLIGTSVDIKTGKFVDASGGWNGGTDSFYEYLIKMYLYDPYRFVHYKDRWIKAADSSIKYLASHPTTRPELTFLAAYRNQTLNLVSQHLACFDGGNFILGGLTLQKPEYIRFGLELTAGCYATYHGTATGIGPETFQWQDSKLAPNASNQPAVPADQAAFYAANGFWVRTANYLLRPEVMESYYYAYRATGDAKYQTWAWEAFVAINKTTATGSGYSSIRNVNKAGGGGFDDFQESFWFAEVLKYAYLIFAEDADWQVKADGTNKFVYNTECHPVKIPGGKGKVADCPSQS